MLSLFRKNGFINSLLLLAYTFLLQIIPAALGQGRIPPSDIVRSPFLGSLLHILMLFIQAIFINRMVIENRLHRDIMLYPGVFFILYSSILPEFWSFSHLHLANFMVIWALHELFQIYKTSSPAVEIFNASFLIGIASIFCPPAILYLFLIFIGVNNLKKMELVHPIQILIGGALPWFLWFTWQFWRGHGLEVFPSFGNHMGLNVLEIGSTTADMLKGGFFLFLLIFSILLYNEFRKKKHIQAQKKMDILYFALFHSVLVGLFHQPFGWNVLLLGAPMLGVFAGLAISHLKNQTLAETIHFILFLGVILFQLFYFVTLA